MKRYFLADIMKLIRGPHSVTGDRSRRPFANVRPVLEADEDSLVFIAGGRADAQALAQQTRARTIICDPAVDTRDPGVAGKTFVVVADPKLVFAGIVNSLFVERPAWGIHPTASVDPAANVHEETYIGPFTYVGRADIARGAIIYGHVHIYDGVRIGENTIIHAGTVIGADGFGYLRAADDSVASFPHVGGVDIEDDVEIGANTCIDRGSLGNTIVRRGAKIDNLVHIAHNVVVGRDAFVIANAMIGGSTVLGDGSWISPSATLRDAIRIGRGSTVGLGAVVTKDVPDAEVWAGTPARPLAEFLAMQKKLKNL
jgi:UDP-3-O-[3-hydroxymyristoyl] glucosamine N-acyltransferase